MDLYLLAELQYIKLNISTVDLKKPPKDFRSKFDCTPPPILLDKTQPNEQRAVLENDRIERYILKNVPGGHRLFVRDRETASLIQNLYSVRCPCCFLFECPSFDLNRVPITAFEQKFKLALARDEPHTKNSLIGQLESIDEHLRRRDTRYLTGDHVCCFDCELIARLQHIRVAGPYFLTDFRIPSQLDRLWRYMAHMYELQAFVESCPADQDIVSHYLTDSSLRQRASIAQKVANLHLQVPSYSTSLPPEVES
jgi:chloride intracellular channel protein 2